MTGKRKIVGWFLALSLVPAFGGGVSVARFSGQESATLHLVTLDHASGATVPSRIYLTGPDGKPRVPPGAIHYDKGDEHSSVIRGDCTVALQPGAYSLQVEKGAEFLPARINLDLKPGEKRELRVPLRRWIDMNAQGWYSGDLHNHRKLDQMPELLLAEDLNLAPTLTDWIWEDDYISRAPTSGDPIRVVDARHVYSTMDKEIERLKHGPGAVDLIGLRKPVPFTGHWLSPPNDGYCRLAREQGGYVDAEKIVWRDGCALAALGMIDFAGIVHNHFNRHSVELETAEWGMIPKERLEFDTVAGMPLWSMEVYYRLLNCGFRLPVSGGSASGVKPAPLGYSRVYVKLAEPFGWESWFRALKSGHNFASNGPMLFLSVNGTGPGGTLTLDGTRPAKVRVHAESLSPRPQDRLEILFKGQVVGGQKATAGPEEQKIALDLDVDVADSGWIAARSFEPARSTIRFAHTSPVYIRFGQRIGIVSADAQYFIRWIDREIEHYRQETRFRTPAERAAMLDFFNRARAVYAKLAEQNSN